MAVKLFTIGDSISQGFMSGAAAKTDQSYSTLLSKILGASPYDIPLWEKGGHPIDLETVFRRLQRKLGTDVSGLIEWARATIIINSYLDEVEDYYERGAGSVANCVSKDPFHNVAVRGFNVADSWQLNPKICKDQIEQSENRGDNFFGLVSESFYRTGFRVLASGSEADKSNYTQLDWLEHHHKKEGVENVILWLGANNALGTVLDLKVNQTSSDGTAFPEGPEALSYQKRKKQGWNLWHPEDFRADYRLMLNKVTDILQHNPNNTDYNVFLATIPLVTICPLIKSVESAGRSEIEVDEWPVDHANPAPDDISQLSRAVRKKVSYGKYYPYFLFEGNFDHNVKHLNQQQVLHIDNCIRKYNRIIQELVAEANKKVGTKRFYLVDISDALSQMALKRNDYDPTYKFPDYFKYCYPPIDSRYYGVNQQGDIMAGGLFSLDGVHPTAIGQGLIAWEFLKVMQKAGSFTGDVDSAIDWKAVFSSDTLYSNPIGLIGEIYDNADLQKWLYKMLSKSWEKKKY
ncbi:MAG TPA: hypothetical protein VGB44_00440 [Flavobacterium sp.]|jgi:hypothetical protein